MSATKRQSLAVVPDLSVTGELRGKRILFTGATGFVGKVALSMLLTRFPEIGKIYVMARPGVSTSAEARFFGKVVVAPPFDPLRARLGPDFDAFVREKCEAVSGDVSKENCGLDEETLGRLEGQVDLLINSAGLVDFAPTLEAGLNANAVGAVNVARTAVRLGAKLVHVSTCFVAGERPGYVMEEEELVGYFPKREERPDETFDPFAEIEDCRATIARIRAQAEDKALLAEFRARAAEKLREEGRDDRDARALRIGTMRERKSWVSEALVRAGSDRSRYWGWPNTYCYTKSLGDQVIAAIAKEEGLDFTIARPAIVESAQAFPFPGWNEGFTTTAPLTFLAMKGHRNFVGRKGLVLDVIPVDLIAAGVIAASAALLAGKARRVYQLGTSDQNPLAVDRALELTGLYRRRYYLRKAEEGGKLRNELLARMEPQTVPLETFRKLSAPQIAKLAKTATELLDEWKPSWGAPRIGATIERLQDKLELASQRAEMASQLFELFVPFIWENSYVFSTRNMAQLYARMDPEDAEKIPWDPAGIDWLHYWLDVHMPGLEEWVYPNLEDEYGARGRKRGAPAYRDLWSLLEARARKHPGKVAMRHFQGDESSVRYTYGQLRDRAMRASLYLAACGVEAGDRVLLLSANRPEWAMAFFGAIKAGATVVPVDPEATVEEIGNIVRRSRAKLLVASEPVYRRLLAAGDTPAPAVRLDDLFEGAVEEGEFSPREPAELASLIFTSGTTGTPKGVMLSGRNFTTLVSRLSEVFDLGERDGLLSVLPLHHTFEFTTGLLLPLAVGAEIAYLEERTGESILRAFRTGRITAMVGVPAVWKLLLRRIEEGFEELGLGPSVKLLQEGGRRVHDATGTHLLGRAAFSPVHRKFGGRLRYLISGGSAMPPKIYDAFRGMGFEILEGYGLTEAAPVLTVQRPGQRRAGHVGRPVGGVEIRIHRPDAEGVGEVLAKGPNVMMGYWEDPEATAEALRDGWLHTGDLGRLDEEGNLVLVGRSKDVIVDAAGKNIYPDELEDLYDKHPAIRELSIVGIPAEGGGERVACLVVPETEERDPAEVRREIEAHFREVSLRLPVWKRVKVLHFREEALPRTATQKVRRPEVVRALQEIEKEGKGPRKAAGTGGEAWLFDLVARVCEQPLEKILPEAKLEQDLGFDSLTFTELGAALEQAGIPLPAPEEILALETVAELAALVGRQRRLGKKARHGDAERSESAEPATKKLRSLVGSVIDAVQPAADRIPLLSSALTLAREEGLDLLDDFFTRPARGEKEEEETPPFDLPDLVVSAGRRVLRGGQVGLYENFFHTRLYGTAHVPQHTNFLVAANHASHLDMGLVKHALGDQGKNLAALAARDYFFKDRLRRTYFENFTQLIPMEREGSMRESLDLASRTLKKGNNLLIFPEGTRAQDGEIKEFKGSLGYLALRNRVGILPMYLRGTYEALPKGSLLPKARELSVHIAPFLSFEMLEEVVKGLPRGEQHRAVARLVEKIIRALRDGTPLPPLPGFPPEGPRKKPAPEAAPVEEEIPHRRATPGESKA